MRKKNGVDSFFLFNGGFKIRLVKDGFGYKKGLELECIQKTSSPSTGPVFNVKKPEGGFGGLPADMVEILYSLIIRGEGEFSEVGTKAELLKVLKSEWKDGDSILIEMVTF